MTAQGLYPEIEAPAPPNKTPVATCLVYLGTALALSGVAAGFMLYTGGYLTEGKVARQKRTVYDLRDAAQALRSYRDRHGGFPVGTWPHVAHRLVAEGLAEDLRSEDIYGTPYHYEVTGSTKRPGLDAHFRLRAAGDDKRFESGSPVGPFEPSDFNRDIIVADSQFLQWPQRVRPASR